MENKDRAAYWKHRKILAIDPGRNGGIAVYSRETGRVVEAVKMPETPMELLGFLSVYSNNATCYIEKVGGLPGMGGSSMFNFGRGFGHLEMALLCRKIPTVSVTPQRWQKHLQLGTRGSRTTAEWKNKLKARAEQLFPYIGRITLATSDALLILQYAIHEETGKRGGEEA